MANVLTRACLAAGGPRSRGWGGAPGASCWGRPPGLATLWALLRLGSRSGTQLEKRLIDRGLFEHCEDEWEDSKEHEGVAHCIGGVVMQLAANGDDAARASLTQSGAQALVTAVFAKHPGVSYKGAFASLKSWLREKP